MLTPTCLLSWQKVCRLKSFSCISLQIVNYIYLFVPVSVSTRLSLRQSSKEEEEKQQQVVLQLSPPERHVPLGSLITRTRSWLYLPPLCVALKHFVYPQLQAISQTAGTSCPPAAQWDKSELCCYEYKCA